MSIARFDLRLSEEAFWLLTPREYRALLDRHTEAERRVDLRFGELCALVASVAGVKREGGAPFTPADFFPSLRAPVKKVEPDTRPAAIALEDSVAEGWMAWARDAERVAELRGLAQVAS